MVNIYLAATVLGAAAQERLSTLGQNAEFVSVTFVGMMLDRCDRFLGDRFGRRFTIKRISHFRPRLHCRCLAPSMRVLILLQFIID